MGEKCVVGSSGYWVITRYYKEYMIFLYKIQDCPDLPFSAEMFKKKVIGRVYYGSNTAYVQKDPLSDKRKKHGLCPVHYETELKRLKKAIRQMKSTHGSLKSTRKDW
jgi:hypothetical protein